MLDANRTRHFSLVTEADWTRCTAAPDDALRWSAAAGALTLAPRQYRFAAARERPAWPEEAGRGGVFDRHGNLYALAADRRGVVVRSAGSGRVAPFWPVGDAATQGGVGAIQGRPPHPEASGAAAQPADGRFHPSAPPAGVEPVTLEALTVSSGHYLVAAAGALGLLVFDLHGGGPPVRQPWPGLGPVEALHALAGGGVAALVGNALWPTGPSLRPCVPAAPPWRGFPAPGAPVPSASPPSPATPPHIELQPALPAGGRATAVLAWDGGWLVFGRAPGDDATLWLGALDADGRARPLRDGDATAATLDLGAPIRRAARPADAAAIGALAGRAVALARLPGQPAGETSLFVVAAGGDQAFRFRLTSVDGSVVPTLEPEFWPMRRHEGGGLAALPDDLVLHDAPDARLFHAAGDGWVPLLRLDRPVFAREAELVTPIWDGGVDGCVWHRLMLDARVPTGTAVTLQTRCVDGAADADRARPLLAAQPWRDEPAFAVHPQGSERPWSTPAAGVDTRDVLLQAARGRWLQARLLVSGDGRRTPALRALRVWAPRFSYAERYLPPVYREDAAGADFLDRLLALFEGEFTRWEDRIATAQWLIDARTAPEDALPWLADWVALQPDAADTPGRLRQLIRHAVAMHARRGTVPGLLLGATLAWEPELDEAWFDDPAALATRPHGVRLQELFALAGALPAGVWQPAQGAGALLAALGDDPSLVAADGARRGVLMRALGVVPRAAVEEAALWQAWQRGAAAPLPEDRPADAAARADWQAYLAASAACAPLRSRWQAFLVRRWRRPSALNAAWGTHWRAFDEIPSPVLLPSSRAALADWHRFETRVLRLEPYAHRFRVVLPLPAGTPDPAAMARRLAAVRRAIDRDRPAHTVAELRFGFDLFRVGEARLGLDTLLHDGLARHPELAALGRRAILGGAELGQARLEPPRPLPPADRVGLDRGAAS